MLIIELIYSSILWINAFPPKCGLSSTLSPRNILTGIQFDYNKHCKLQFGSYAQAHHENSPTNTQSARTVGAICLGPTRNIEGSFKFLNLRTGKRITGRRWTTLTMPQEVIERVNKLGAADDQPELLTFYDQKGRFETPGVPDIVDTDIPDEDDRLEDLNPPIVNEDYGVPICKIFPMLLLRPSKNLMIQHKNSKSRKKTSKFRIQMMKSTRISKSLRNPFLKCQIQERYSLVALNAPVLNRNDSSLLSTVLRLTKAPLLSQLTSHIPKSTKIPII